MDHTKILKRAWNILWQYKALWVFGIIVALTAGGSFQGSFSGGGGSGRGSDGHEGSSFEFILPDDIESGVSQLRSLPAEINAEPPTGVMLGLVIAGLCLALILVVVTSFLRYISETALVRMVDEYEEDGTKHKVGQGFRLGWSRMAWRSFLVDLVIGIPSFFVFMFLIALAGSPFLLLLTENEFFSIVGVVLGIGFFIIAILLMILFAALINFLVRFSKRAVILEGNTVFDAIKRGYGMIRGNIKDSGLMWLILIGIQIAYQIALLPIGFILFLVGIMFAGIAFVAVGGPTVLLVSDPWGWIVGAVPAIFLMMIIVGTPMTFVEGLKETYISTTWTLTYRELLAYEKLPASQTGDEEQGDSEDDEPELLEEEIDEE